VDGDIAKEFIISTLPDKGVLSFKGHGVHEGDIIPVEQLERLRYKPVLNGAGEDYTRIGYKIVNDGVNSVSNEAFYHVNVFEMNDLPWSSSFDISVKEDGQYRFARRQFTFHDVEKGEMKSLKISDLPTHGDLYVGNKIVRDIIFHGEILPKDLHKLRYVPDDDFFGYDRIGFGVVDQEDLVGRGYGVEISVGEVAHKIIGTSGNDVLYGKRESNILYGLRGNDHFRSKSGEDIYIGGAGRDIFFLTHNSGVDTVRDFHANKAHDIVFLQKIPHLDTYKELVDDYVEEKGNDLWIYYSKDHEGSALFLKHTSLDDVDKDLFWL
jgi:Ca2+-binding RTX toxin-like protein